MFVKKTILYVAVLISIATYSFWEYMPKGFFYKGNAFFIFFVSLYIFLNDKKSFIKFVLISLSLNNLVDETMLQNTSISLNEYITAIFILLIGLTRFRNGRKRTNN